MSRCEHEEVPETCPMCNSISEAERVDIEIGNREKKDDLDHEIRGEKTYKELEAEADSFNKSSAYYAGKCLDLHSEKYALQAKLSKAVEALNWEPMDCGDNACRFAVNKSGQRTNGGCRCIRSLDTGTRIAIEKTHHKQKQFLTDMEAK